ncbi:MAG: hypothetical protein M3537_05910 [Chloroflexota bacterium]|nr:hypothetical protein [Chloroflexota bacterium]
MKRASAGSRWREISNRACRQPSCDEKAEFYEALARLLAARPRGTTVPEVLASDAGQRIRTKWMLKYGRQPPL